MGKEIMEKNLIKMDYDLCFGFIRLPGKFLFWHMVMY